MKHFVLQAQPGEGGIIRLYEKDYHYLVRVRRLRSGMVFDAILPGGKIETKVRILSTRDNILIGQCIMESTIEEEKTRPEKSFPTGSSLPDESKLPPIALFQGLPKGAKMDLIVRQAAEAGVSVVAPFKCEYSQTAPGKDPGEKLKRWERVVREARQQSGSVMETKVLPPCSFDALLEYWGSIGEKYSRPLGILLHQEPLEKGTFHGYLGNDPDFVVLAVGPEGGFSPGELTQFLKTGFRPLLMGNTILRTETAALYGIAAIRIILLESEAWTPCPTELCFSEPR
jgi:16S rRNA (uracil1498-N3)-methyltransferase